MPFDQLIIFSTNLEPKDLVDEAFLRRIPYKINVADPDDDEMHELFRLLAPTNDCEYDPDAVEHLLTKHYRACSRPKAPLPSARPLAADSALLFVQQPADGHESRVLRHRRGKLLHCGSLKAMSLKVTFDAQLALSGTLPG